MKYFLPFLPCLKNIFLQNRYEIGLGAEYLLQVYISMAGPMFPSLLPKVADPLWFNVDKPCDDESELTKMEEEHAAWV